MAAQSIGVFTINFPDLNASNYQDDDHFTTLPANNSFRYPITSNIQTLSPKDVERGNDPYGLLYVPHLASDDCKETELRYVPANVTREANLPPDPDYALIAIAPWFSKSCIVQYFEAARKPAIKGFITYLPDRGNDMPPVMNDPAWLLDDGGSWKVANTFPTYAISSTMGGNIMQALAVYSGNITKAPYADDILSSNPDFRPTDYLRLWSTVSIDPGSRLPSLWVFLVIVLGLLIVVIGGTSLAMHVLQRRRRNNLRQRIINGEVDLEAIGVKRLTVPQQFLEKLPLYTYSGPSDAEDAEKNLAQASVQTKDVASPKAQPQSSQTAIPNSAPPTDPSFSQSTCSICLDDFEPQECQVRELPCHHIYHADCIDPFLLNNSSLCPLCKQSVLPAGYCPTRITNIMVRRERLINRMRQRRAAQNGAAGPSNTQTTPSSAPAPAPAPRPQRNFASMGSRIGGAVSGAFAGRRIFSAPGRAQQAPDIEMAPGTSSPSVSQIPNPDLSGTTPGPAVGNAQVSNSQPSPAQQNRSEWLRQRAMALLGDRPIPDIDEEEEERNASRWKRGLKKVFPGFR
ncbi:hypothetical protein DM02DRAFT_331174 [Periconia macrospinosa]|uniref:RING-type domain-containing protein n=1 Tax=Periconia macrospinosa TaxID=97972 RepID=A0A2V1D0W8_9PLEO|nr:hypothetical protein DM02DRAFT_331174 [Periconia macrospinosa]